jgi:hypothetical protein
MLKYKVLSLLEILSQKKDLLWSKKYFAELEDSLPKSLLIFSDLYEKKNIKEIHSIESPSPNILEAFVDFAMQKLKSRYILYELNESNEVKQIEQAHRLGFKRFNRNYTFIYKNSRICESNCPAPQIFCRPAELEDIKDIEEIDIASQMLEYRDELFRSRKFIKNIILNTWVFTPARNSSQVIAFCCSKESYFPNCFEFIIPSSSSNMLYEILDSFAEQYINFEKNLDFRFVIDENHKNLLDSLSKDFELCTSSQLLIYEGLNKSKIKKTSALSIWIKALNRSISPKARRSFLENDRKVDL